jgi:hypothetical protein
MVAMLAIPPAARAAGKTPRIGLLQPGPRPPAWIEAFRQGLRELGFIEGQNIVIEHRLARDLANERRWPRNSPASTSMSSSRGAPLPRWR